ncbi:glycosyltransferase 87 family protein [Kitasatospora sp. NPDC058406]|uniref:glycosyltransferase 87 family protein n=1 Tax=Streptomycetaceae TaxID=2062 RepID=UPI002E7A8046|nr:glycosyltransferase 87 family protein [Streptomyces sp. BE303]MED7955481.1 glycosyltransferase 87 family protein [Streptomyces sp. BE303]
MVSTRTPGYSRPRGRFTGRGGTPDPPGPDVPPARPARLRGRPPRRPFPHQRGESGPPVPLDRLNPARLAGHRGVQLLGCLVAAGWAAAFPVVSDLPNQRLWGAVAAPSYLLAGLFCLALPRRVAARSAAAVALLGAVLVPLAVLALQGRHQSEVMVVERSAHLLFTTGSPYLPDPVTVTDYNPYLPGMAVFGVPRALLGDGNAVARLAGDARIWFALAFVACLVAGWRLLRPSRDRAPLLPLTVLTASPLIALALVGGGVDLPLIGLCCLAMALAERDRTVPAGLVLALAGTLKWTVWPALPVAVLLLWRLYGRRPAGKAGLTALGAGLVVMAPIALVRADALREQVVRFPLGLTAIQTPAGSPLPGKVLAGFGPTGHTASLVLLTVGGLGVAIWLLARPPVSAIAAADLLAAGLAIAFMLAPAGRFGYLALPVVLMIWPRLAARRWTARPPRPVGCLLARPEPALPGR